MISEKEEILNIMRANVEKMKYGAKNAERNTTRLRVEQTNDYPRQQNNLFNNKVSHSTQENNVTGCKSQNRLYVHSTLNGMQPNIFNNTYNNYGD